MEKLLIPYSYLRFVIHIIRLGLRYSTVKGFEVERDWLLAWCNGQQASLVDRENLNEK